MKYQLIQIASAAFASFSTFCCPVRAFSTKMASKSKTYDLVVIGGGSAGLTAAKLAGGTLGKSVVIVERAKLGGDCTWTGCVPSKSLIASAKAAQATRKQMQQNPPISFKEVRQRFENNVNHIFEEDDSAEALAKFNVDTITGAAKLTSSKVVKVDDSFDIQAKEGIILCTGAVPKFPGIPGLDTVKYITYEDVWELEELPKKLTVVGGGPIGCELAQAFQRLGSDCTIICNRLLPREEPEVSEILEDIFKDEGIIVKKGTVTEVRKEGGSGHKALYKGNDGSTGEVTGDTLLVSIGRSPTVKGLGLEDIGVEADEKKGIVVNDKLQTSVKGVYAAGDCTGDRQFTHYAGFQGAIAARNILLPLTDPGVLSEIPAATFTTPEVASVGLREAAARKEYGNDAVAVSSIRLEHIDRAICDGETKGIMKVVYKKKNGQILGATMMSPSGGELISEICVMMNAKMPFHALAKVIHPYPSYAIALQMMAADVYYEKTMKLKWLYDFLKKIGL